MNIDKLKEIRAGITKGDWEYEQEYIDAGNDFTLIFSSVTMDGTRTIRMASENSDHDAKAIALLPQILDYAIELAEKERP